MSEIVNHDDEKKEIIDNMVFHTSPGTVFHSIAAVNLQSKFLFYFIHNNKKSLAFPGNIEVYLNKENNNEYVIPDICIVFDKNKITKKGCIGTPDLIVEVLSPSTIKKDRTIKFKLYEKARIKEYWIVDVNNKSIEQYILTGEKYDLRDVVNVMDEDDLNKLSDERKKQYSTKIKPYVIEDLEIDLKEVFEF